MSKDLLEVNTIHGMNVDVADGGNILTKKKAISLLENAADIRRLQRLIQTTLTKLAMLK